MQTGYEIARVPEKALWTGRVLSSVPVLMLLFAGGIKVIKLPSVVQGFVQNGYHATLVPVIGMIEIGCVIIYLIPRTAVLGAILMTRELGGAIELNVRTGNLLYVAPLILGFLVWGGIYLRDPRLRTLIPLRD